MNEDYSILIEALKKAKKVGVLTGAGVSTLSGIPDFCGPQGLYKNPDAERIFDIDWFDRDPSVYYKGCRELGVDLDAKLLPYQRNEGSGSQTALERLMGETPIMPPIEEDRLAGMGGIISETADYRNYPGAIGFTFRYYANELVRDKRIKLLKIDGIEPTVENIRSGQYPFVETAYAITVSERKGNMKKFIDFLVSPVGQSLIEKTGYVTP